MYLEIESENIESKLALRNKVCIKQNEIVKINKFANILLSKSYENIKIASNRLKGRRS